MASVRLMVMAVAKPTSVLIAVGFNERLIHLLANDYSGRGSLMGGEEVLQQLAVFP